MFGDAEPVAPDQTRIEPTDGEPAFAQEFFEVMLVVDAQIRTFDELLRDAREIRKTLHDLSAFFFGERVAFEQCLCIIAERELFGFFQPILQWAMRFENIVIPRGGGVARQEHDERQVIVQVEIKRGEIQHNRDEHEPVQVHAVSFLQISRKTRRARGAIRLADQKFWREPAVVTRGVQTDKIADQFNVFFEAVPLLRRNALHRSRVARVHRINENEIGLIEDRIFIVLQLIRRLRQIAIVLQQHAARTQHAEMQPHRRRARSAVERKRQRTLRRVADSVLGVRDEEDLCARLLALRFFLAVGCLLFHHHRPRCDGVLDGLAADLDGMFRCDEIVYGFDFFLFFLLLFCHVNPPIKFGDRCSVAKQKLYGLGIIFFNSLISPGKSSCAISQIISS